MIHILATVIVVIILCWLAFWVLGQFPVGEPIDKLARVVIVVVAVLALIWAVYAALGAGVLHFGGGYGFSPNAVGRASQSA